MKRPLHILVVEDESGLASEVDRAIGGFDRQVFLHVANTMQAGFAEARTRLPDAICFPMPRDIEVLRAAATEFGEVSPNSVLIGVLDSGAFDSGDEESAYLIRALRSQVRDFLRLPVSSDELAEVLARNLESRTVSTGLGRICSVFSNKGGVGKTTLAVNIATELAIKHPGKVLLIDGALQLALCSTALGLRPTSTLVDATDQINRLDPTLLRELATRHPSGLHLLAGPTDAIEATRIGEGELLRLLGIARRAYEYVVVDTFPVLDSIALAVLDRSDDVFVVFSPTVPTVLGVEALLPVLDSVGVAQKARRLIVNNSLPNHAGRLGIDDIEARLGTEVAFAVPFSRHTLRATNSGEPAVMGASRWSGFRRAVRKIVATVEQGSPEPDRDHHDGDSVSKGESAHATREPKERPSRGRSDRSRVASRRAAPRRRSASSGDGESEPAPADEVRASRGSTAPREPDHLQGDHLDGDRREADRA